MQSLKPDKMSVKLDLKLQVGAPPWKRELMLRRNALARTVEKNLIDKLESSKRCSQLLRHGTVSRSNCVLKLVVFKFGLGL